MTEIKQRILAAGIELFAADPHATMADVASRAGTCKSNASHHGKTKEELFRMVFVHMHDAAVQAREAYRFGVDLTAWVFMRLDDGLRLLVREQFRSEHERLAKEIGGPWPESAATLVQALRAGAAAMRIVYDNAPDAQQERELETWLRALLEKARERHESTKRDDALGLGA